MIFDENETFTEIYFLYHSQVSMACTKNSNAKFTKKAKIKVANTQSSVCFETVFWVSWTLCILLMPSLDALPLAIDIQHYYIIINSL